MAEHGMTPTAYLDSLGLLTENTTLAHAVWMTDDDLKIIADRGSVLVHNPVSNCRLGSGTFRFAEAEKSRLPHHHRYGWKQFQQQSFHV